MKQYENRLSKIRKANQESQEQVAALLKIKRMTYSKYENGLSKIPVEQAIILARHFDVSMDYLCGISNINRGFPRDQDTASPPSK
ncbi:MAG: helix-turn-helix domain-containing protein [Lachnospiraceae bacterium]|nr:helix-turn-helix domain-containing protein [Lachnospiraceae bacterium]